MLFVSRASAAPRTPGTIYCPWRPAASKLVTCSLNYTPLCRPGESESGEHDRYAKGRDLKTAYACVQGMPTESLFQSS